MYQEKAEWGTKRVCQSCAARFYDLARLPPTCPKCGAEFVVVVRPAPVPRKSQKWKSFDKGDAALPSEAGNENLASDGSPADDDDREADDEREEEVEEDDLQSEDEAEDR